MKTTERTKCNACGRYRTDCKFLPDGPSSCEFGLTCGICRGDVIEGFILKHPEISDAWMYVGSSKDEMLRALSNEIDTMDSGEDFAAIEISIREFSRKEIEEMPEFEGW